MKQKRKKKRVVGMSLAACGLQPQSLSSDLSREGSDEIKPPIFPPASPT